MLSNLKPKSEFSRNVITLMMGTTIAQAIPVAISPNKDEDAINIVALGLMISTCMSVVLCKYRYKAFGTLINIQGSIDL